jgi:TolB-like protein/Flp pilus assembly protein TadD
VTPGPSLAKAPSVAVLPFSNLSSDPENEFFADGITEDVIAQLAKVRTMKVISRASVMPFKKRDVSLRQIAEQLDVANLLEGSVRRAGNRVRVVVQLVEAATDRSLWAETYDRQLDDIFAIQSDIALSIANSLKTQLTSDERARIDRAPTDNMQAYQHYMRARQLLVVWDQAFMWRSIEQFQRAIDLDPNFALPYAGIAQAYAELCEVSAISGPDAYPKARDAAAQALKLDPELAEAHTMSGYVKLIFEYDWEGAEKAFRRALELQPGNSDTYDLYGRLCAAVGRFDEAVALQERAFVLDPTSHKTDVATALLRAGRNVDAEAAARRSLTLDPEYPRGLATLGWALYRQGRIEEGLASLRKAVSLAPGELIWLAQLGQALALAGRRDEARAILSDLEARKASPYHRGYIEVGLGEVDRAMDFLEQSVEARADRPTGSRARSCGSRCAGTRGSRRCSKDEPRGHQMKIAILGAGSVGATLGGRWATDHEVTFGVRPGSARELPAGARSLGISEAVAGAEVVVLATPWPAVPDALRSAGDLSGKVLLDATNPLGAGMKLDVGPHGESGAERIASWAPGRARREGVQHDGIRQHGRPGLRRRADRDVLRGRRCGGEGRGAAARCGPGLRCGRRGRARAGTTARTPGGAVDRARRTAGTAATLRSGWCAGRALTAHARFPTTCFDEIPSECQGIGMPRGIPMAPAAYDLMDSPTRHRGLRRAPVRFPRSKRFKH